MQPWWADSHLEQGPEGLELDGVPLARMARDHGTPVYVYSRRAILDRVAELRGVLASAGVPFRLYYAMKANRCPALLAALRAEGRVGIDACSPGEVEHALANGFAPQSLSVTAGMLSNQDLDALAGAGVHVNLDSLSALRRYGQRVRPGTAVGLRLNPGVLMGYRLDPKLNYGNSKIGIYRADFARALAVARDAGLIVDTLHIHCGWNLQSGDLPALEEALAHMAACAGQVPTLTTLNVGGGLGVRHAAADSPLTPAAWAGALARHVAPLGLNLACEPGTFLVATAGVLVAEVNTVETKGGICWAGVNAGHNLNVYPYHYGIPLQIVAVGQPFAAPTGTYTVAGNINEAGDLWGRNVPMPDLAEGDLLAFLPAGAYGASMASDHCLRGNVREVLV